MATTESPTFVGDLKKILGITPEQSKNITEKKDDVLKYLSEKKEKGIEQLNKFQEKHKGDIEKLENEASELKDLLITTDKTVGKSLEHEYDEAKVFVNNIQTKDISYLTSIKISLDDELRKLNQKKDAVSEMITEKSQALTNNLAPVSSPSTSQTEGGRSNPPINDPFYYKYLKYKAKYQNLKH